MQSSQFTKLRNFLNYFEKNCKKNVQFFIFIWKMIFIDKKYWIFPMKPLEFIISNSVESCDGKTAENYRKAHDVKPIKYIDPKF